MHCGQKLCSIALAIGTFRQLQALCVLKDQQFYRLMFNWQMFVLKFVKALHTEALHLSEAAK